MPAKKKTTKKTTTKNTATKKTATKKTATKKTATNKATTKNTAAKAKENKLIVKKVTPQDSVPVTLVVGKWVHLELESGFIRTVDWSGAKKLLKEVNEELATLTDGAVSITDAITREVNGIDTNGFAEKLWY